MGRKCDVCDEEVYRSSGIAGALEGELGRALGEDDVPVCDERGLGELGDVCVGLDEKDCRAVI